MPTFNANAIFRILTTACGNADPILLKSLDRQAAVATLVTGLNASRTPEELAQLLLVQMPKSRRTAQDLGELHACVDKLLEALPVTDESRDAAPRGPSYEFTNRNTKRAVDLAFSGAAFTSQDANAKLPSTLKMLPIEAKLKVDESQARAGVKACAVEVGLSVAPDTNVTLEGLCGAAEAGLNPGGLLLFLKEGRLDRGLGVLRKSFNFATLTATTKIPAENGCRYDASAKVGVGSIGPEIRVAENAFEAYQGTGTLGLGMALAKSCPSQNEK